MLPCPGNVFGKLFKHLPCPGNVTCELETYLGSYLNLYLPCSGNVTCEAAFILAIERHVQPFEQTVHCERERMDRLRNLHHYSHKVFIRISPPIPRITELCNLPLAHMNEYVEFGACLPEFGSRVDSHQRELVIQEGKVSTQLCNFLLRR